MHLPCGNDGDQIIRNNLKIDNYFQHRRWQLVTLLEQLAGFWPRQSKPKQYPLELFHLLILSSVLSAVVIANKMRKEYESAHTDMVIECFLFMLFGFSLVVKLTFASIFQSRRQQNYIKIAEHFKTMTDTEEASVLKEAADQGFKYTVYYISTMSTFVTLFDICPILKIVHNYLFLDGEIKLQLPAPMDYGFDHKKYWYFIALDFLTFIYSSLAANFAYDLSFILQIRHVQALFKIIGMRLDKATELADQQYENGQLIGNAADESYSIISSAIDLHSECLEMIRVIEQTYATSWFVILMLSTLGFGGGLYAISTKLHDPIESFRYCCLYVTVLIHFQVIFSQGQIIIDTSSTVSAACYGSSWYNLPKKACQLLNTAMIRSSKPCQLTGGKLFPLSMKSFSQLLKTGLSYYTVFQS